MLVGAEDILTFWLDEISPEQWYIQDEDLDKKISEKFQATWDEAMEGSLGLWLTYPSGALAYIVLMDQFPRNMFRGSGKAFASDKIALAVAKQAIHRGWDMKIDEPARQFFYLPLMHSENLCDQERCIRLMKERMPETGEANLIHAKAHREVIRLFGRFPYRNDVLDRAMTDSEQEYVEQGGYGSTLRALQNA